MKFMFAVEVEVKNDALTQEAGEHALVVMLMNHLEDNKLSTLPWVIDQYYGYLDTKE